MEFKVGDEVVVPDSNTFNPSFNGRKGKLTSIDGSINPYQIDFDDGGFGWVNEVKKSNYKQKNPTHVVIWDEESRDPHKFFTDEEKAKDFTKELSEKSNVKKDSIILVEIKSAQKVNITKSIRFTGYKI